MDTKCKWSVSHSIYFIMSHLLQELEPSLQKTVIQAAEQAGYWLLAAALPRNDNVPFLSLLPPRKQPATLLQAVPRTAIVPRCTFAGSINFQDDVIKTSFTLLMGLSKIKPSWIHNYKSPGNSLLTLLSPGRTKKTEVFTEKMSVNFFIYTARFFFSDAVIATRPLSAYYEILTMVLFLS